jgi:GAF domain-containing protein
MTPPTASAARLLEGLDAAAPDWAELVRRVLAHFRSETVTLHRIDSRSGELALVASNPELPPPLLESIRSIPVGRGMAGVAALEKRPVTTCNLQTDSTEKAIRPGAKQTGMRGAVVVPVLARDGRTVAGTLGIGTTREHEYTPAEVADLESLARAIGERW